MFGPKEAVYTTFTSQQIRHCTFVTCTQHISHIMPEAVEMDTEPSTSYPTDGPFHLKATCTGHTKAVASVRFSPSGKLLASVSADKTFKLWSVPDGVIQGPPSTAGTMNGGAAGSKADAKQQHSEGINDVAWNPSSTYIATASDDLTAKIWDVETRKCLSTMSGHTNYVFCCHFNPAGNILVSARGNKWMPKSQQLSAASLNAAVWQIEYYSNMMIYMLYVC